MLTSGRSRDEGHLTRNIARVRDTIAAAAQRSGRLEREITLVAVSKTMAPDVVLAAAELGLTDFGENRVQEAEQKMDALAGRLPGGIAWHLIGHLQTNKAKSAVEHFKLIHSVDTTHLAQALSKLGQKRGQSIDILLEVNIAAEPTKFGFEPEKLAQAMPELASLTGLRVCGLMTVAPLAAKPEEARPYFQLLRELRDRLGASNPGVDLTHLSMGMTNDYPIAIEEGATIVRVGRAIFGER